MTLARDWVREVLSSGHERKDRVHHLRPLQRAALPYYWILSPEDRVMHPLTQLHADINARVRAILEAHPGWLCGKGCGGCCRALAEVPQLTADEWGLLREGLALFAPDQLRNIQRDIAALAEQQARPLVCPLLDQQSSTCLVYAQRPTACRTYGFYVQRELGLYCHDLETRVASGSLADVVWGNQDAIDHRLAALGETRPLTA
jgi:Fe-S-cluster containining protein